MLKKRPRLATVAVAAATVTASAALAAGFGAGGSAAVLGQPLDFAVPVRLEAGETLTADCLSAEVTVGDRRLPGGLVQTALEGAGSEAPRVRVFTAVVMDEPIVGVLLQAGCASKFSRRFVVLADPPAHAPQVAAPAFAALPADADAGGNLPAAHGGAGAALAAVASVPESLTRRVASIEPQAERRVRSAAPASGPRRVAAAAPRAARRAQRTQPPVARLRLDLALPAFAVAEANGVEQALNAVAQAAAAARESASAASAARERIAQLERNVDKLRSDAQASRDLAGTLRERLAQADGAGRWQWPLLALVGLLAAMAGWLALRLSAAHRARDAAWRQAAGSAPPVGAVESTASKPATSPVPFVASDLKMPATVPGRARTAPAWPPQAPPDPWAEAQAALPLAAAHPTESAVLRTQPLPAGVQPDGNPPRDVTIEELIDLEQQADFFVVLGQDDAAIELLVEHVRQTGGGSPLPYLKLLEIHRRRGDRADYERTRTRFNHRFNAYAPEWDIDLASGRALEDYTGIVPRLQQVWARPIEAMAELESLLFRRSRGELFDLPAYREVLFLYALARDLLDREAADSGSVDLLLPMASGANGGDFSSTAPAPYLELGRELPAGPRDAQDRPTAPVDFDVSQDLDRPISIFDPLAETQPFRRR